MRYLGLVVPDYNSLIGWIDSIVLYVRSGSKATVATLSNIVAHPSYWKLHYFLRKLKPTFSEIRSQEDVITTFDNEQKLKQSYRIGGAEGSNKMTIYLCTMVPTNFVEDNIYSDTLDKLKESWWKNMLVRSL